MDSKKQFSGLLKIGGSSLLDLFLFLCLISLIFFFVRVVFGWTMNYLRFGLEDNLEIYLVFLFIVKILFNLNAGLTSLFEKIHRFENKLFTLLRPHRGNIALSILVFFVALLPIEVYFRYFLQALPQPLGNYLATGYNDNFTGIYRYNPEMKMYLMRPNYERKMYFNGYRWHHKTDAMGFRNPVTLSSADIVLLGDSIVYGHGVEETATIRHFLEKMVRKPVVNLGIQQNSIHQEYQVLKHFGIKLQPEYVFVFFLQNDIIDLTMSLRDEEMEKFLDIPISDHQTPYFETRPLLTNWLHPINQYVRELYVIKAYIFLKKYLRTGQYANAESLIEDNDSWQSLSFFQHQPRLLLATKFHLQALRKIQDLADTYHFKFVNIFVYTGFFRNEEDLYEQVLQAFCHKHDIEFLSLRNGFQAALENGQKLFLEGDGHFSEQGARLAAELIVALMNKLSSGN